MGWDEIVGKSSSSSGSAKCLMANENIHSTYKKRRNWKV